MCQPITGALNEMIDGLGLIALGRERSLDLELRWARHDGEFGSLQTNLTHVRALLLDWRRVRNQRLDRHGLSNPSKKLSPNYLVMISQLNIRVLTGADAPIYRPLRLAALTEQPPAFGMPVEEFLNMSDDQLTKWLEPRPEARVLGAFIGDNLVGTIRSSLFNGSNEKHRAFIAGFYVKPEFRGQGIGRLLFREVLGPLKTFPGVRIIALSVVSSQRPAIRLYESFGFSRYATQREAFSFEGNYFDEHLMELDLVER